MSFLESYRGKKVLVTGHTGFKGSWLCVWLKQLGAEVIGLSNGVLTQPSHFELAVSQIESLNIDIRDREKTFEAITSVDPDVVFHMAAQSLVRPSYEEPVETFATNVMGTIHVLEALRETQTKAAIVVTSDKCYENKEIDYAYKEGDPLGGFDPYSASKGATEIVTSSYQRSFFSLKEYGKSHNCLIGSVRAGNVIGGGDWSEFRLLPDIFRAYANNEEVVLKNPEAVRPWQHVLEPLSGYLKLAEKYLQGETQLVGPWNFGPDRSSCISVGEVVEKVQSCIPELNFSVQRDEIHEATLLMLDSSKANSQLNWQPTLTINQAVEFTANWYKSFYKEDKVITNDQIRQYSEMLKN